MEQSKAATSPTFSVAESTNNATSPTFLADAAADSVQAAVEPVDESRANEKDSVSGANSNGTEWSSTFTGEKSGTSNNVRKRRPSSLAEDLSSLFPLHQAKSISSISSEFSCDPVMSENFNTFDPSTLTNGQQHPNGLVNPNQGLLSNVWHTQLALWTFTLSTVLTTLYRGRCRPRAVIFACLTMTATFFVSCALVVLVVAAHVFSTRKHLFAMAVFRQRQAQTASTSPAGTTSYGFFTGNGMNAGSFGVNTGGSGVTVEDHGLLSPLYLQQPCRSMSSMSSKCSSLLGSVPNSGASSPTSWKNGGGAYGTQKQPVFWQRKMSVEQTYFGTVSPSSTSRL